MKNGILIAASLIIAGTAHANPQCSCGYPLNATAAQYTAFGLTPFPTVTGQSASYNVLNTGGGTNTLLYTAASQSAATAIASGQGGDVTLPSSGVVAFEMEIQNFLSDEPTVSYDEMLSLSIRSGTSYKAGVTVLALHAPYTSSRVIAYQNINGELTDTGSANAISIPLSPAFRLGIYFNMDTRKVGYTINGVNKGYLAQSIPTDVTKAAVTIEAVTNASTGEAQLGKFVKANLITEAGSMNQPYPSSAKDICGNTI